MMGILLCLFFQGYHALEVVGEDMQMERVGQVEEGRFLPQGQDQSDDVAQVERRLCQ